MIALGGHGGPSLLSRGPPPAPRAGSLSLAEQAFLETKKNAVREAIGRPVCPLPCFAVTARLRSAVACDGAGERGTWGRRMGSGFEEELLQRLDRYVRIDTQSDASSTTSPSTAKQYELLNLLVEELG